MMQYGSYFGTVVEHKDGDTSIFNLDLGFRIHFTDEFRWIGVDAPEKWTELGKISAAALKGILPHESICRVYTFEDGKKKRDKKDKYGRWLAEVWTVHPNGDAAINVNQWLVDGGYAREYHGEKRTWLSRFIGR
jgi:endonuclease YncB( thermonuclease family)